MRDNRTWEERVAEFILWQKELEDMIEEFTGVRYKYHTRSWLADIWFGEGLTPDEAFHKWIEINYLQEDTHDGS